MQHLAEIKVDGRQIAFEHGMLLLHEHLADERGHWHIILLRVSPADVLRAADDPEEHLAVFARTTRGECMVGWARARPFRAVRDCLRLVGVSALDWSAG